MGQFDDSLGLALARLLTEGAAATFYKGLTARTGYANYEHQVGAVGRCTPGFLSALKIGWIYAEPALTGSPDDPSLIVAVDLNPGDVQDRTDEFVGWCRQAGQASDVSLGFPPAWRLDQSIWTVRSGGSGHAGVSCYAGNDFVYCGRKVAYRVFRHYDDQRQWAADRRLLTAAH